MPTPAYFIFYRHRQFLGLNVTCQSMSLIVNDIPILVSAHLSGRDNSDNIILPFDVLKKKKQKEVGHRDDAPNSYTLDPMNNCKPIPTTYIPIIQRIKEFIRGKSLYNNST